MDKFEKQRKVEMTEDQKVRCHAIIHTAAVAAGGGNAVPLPGLGLAADTAALVGMAIGLSSVFGRSVDESIARAMAFDALKKTMLKQPVKVIAKEFSKILPVFGSVFAATVSAGLVEAAGWSIVAHLEAEESTALVA